MAEKLPTTPNGIICVECGLDLPPYHFFNFRNKYDRAFWANGLPANNNTCFDCCGPYRCICCHEVKPASEFRLQGRICKSCKSAGGLKNASTHEFARINTNVADETVGE